MSSLTSKPSGLLLYPRHLMLICKSIYDHVMGLGAYRATGKLLHDCNSGNRLKLCKYVGDGKSYLKDRINMIIYQ